MILDHGIVSSNQREVSKRINRINRIKARRYLPKEKARSYLLKDNSGKAKAHGRAYLLPNLHPNPTVVWRSYMVQPSKIEMLGVGEQYVGLSGVTGIITARHVEVKKLLDVWLKHRVSQSIKSTLLDIINEARKFLDPAVYYADSLTANEGSFNQMNSFILKYHSHLSSLKIEDYILPEIDCTTDGDLIVEWKGKHAKMVMLFLRKYEGKDKVHYYSEYKDAIGKSYEITGELPGNELDETLLHWMTKYLNGKGV